MAKEKKPEKNKGSKKGTITCERTYVADRCLRTANQEIRRSSPSPPTLRIKDLPCKHRRKGAIRYKRPPRSLVKSRPVSQRVDNEYVETSFVDKAVSPLHLQGAPTPSCSYTSHGSPNNAVSNSCGSSTSTEGSITRLPSIKFAAMKSSAEPPPRPGEGIIDEFPAYVPWKAEQRAEEDPLACSVCHKCRCSTCQKLCMYPGMRVCGLINVRSRCDEACVETTTVCLPCVQKTARCPTINAARAEAAAKAEAAAWAEAYTKVEAVAKAEVDEADVATTAATTAVTKAATKATNKAATKTAKKAATKAAKKEATTVANKAATKDATTAATKAATTAATTVATTAATTATTKPDIIVTNTVATTAADTVTTTAADTAAITAASTAADTAAITAASTSASTAATTATSTAATTAASTPTETSESEDSGGEPQTARVVSGKCRLRWLLCCLCCPCPYCPVEDPAVCSAGCRGNVNVSGCECVDWEAVRRSNRRRVKIAVKAIQSAREQRRCRDYHYYIRRYPEKADNTTITDTTAADEDNTGTAAADKRSKLRKFLRF